MDSEVVDIGCLDVTVLMGGPSSEREVSLWSGQAVAAALERHGHNVTRGDISSEDVSILDREDIDVVFIALHGLFGESGQVQHFCQERSLPYTGSMPTASRLAMDKGLSKDMFRRAGLATPDWVIVENTKPSNTCKLAIEQLPLPVVVKPVNGGSSFQVFITHDDVSRDKAIAVILASGSKVIVEKYISGRELTVGILAGKTLPLLEIVPAAKFYDFDAKYTDDSGTRYVFDLQLEKSTIDQIYADALVAHSCLGCRDMSRVDFILDKNSCCQILEINTIPGFTKHSLLPLAAKQAGINFDKLIDMLIKNAWSRR